MPELIPTEEKHFFADVFVGLKRKLKKETCFEIVLEVVSNVVLLGLMKILEQGLEMLNVGRSNLKEHLFGLI